MVSRSFPDKLRTLRQRFTLTQTALAQQLGLAQHSYISNLEAGRKAPSLELVVRIADLFGVTTDDLLRDQAIATQPMHPADKVVAEPSSPPRLFGPKLRALRLQQRLSQAELAHELGLTRQGYVSNMEIGWRDPSLAIVMRVADYFNVSTDYLLRDTVPVDSITPTHEES